MQGAHRENGIPGGGNCRILLGLTLKVKAAAWQDRECPAVVVGTWKEFYLSERK